MRAISFIYNANHTLKMGRLILFSGLLFLGAKSQAAPPSTASEAWNQFPAGATPTEIGKRVSENLLSRPYMITKFMDNIGSIHYAEICTAYGALGFADLTKNQDLLKRLALRYSPIVEEPKTPLIPVGSHGDFTVFGLVPFELYRLNGDARYLKLAEKMVIDQWKEVNPADGLTHQARWWIDDMYMISAVDSLATRITGKPEYVDHAALFLNAYFSLQQPNGLLPHTNKVPFYWGRGVGWAAAGTTEALITLPENHPRRKVLMDHYQRLMKGLLDLQAPSGLWHQLLDDPNSWEETSCTGMFVYSFVTGINHGWLPQEIYGPAARKGWLALVSKLDEKGALQDVCIGTNQEMGADAYLKRKRVTGDFHGQAPLLWSANAFLRSTDHSKK